MIKNLIVDSGLVIQIGGIGPFLSDLESSIEASTYAIRYWIDDSV